MKIRITAEGFDLSTELDKYTNRKVAHIARSVRRREKAEAGFVVQFAQRKLKTVKQCSCTITVNLGDQTFVAEETTQHMYAALDIAAVQVEEQLKRYAVAQKRHPVRMRLKRLHGAE